MREKINTYVTMFINMLSSNRFLYFVILLFIFQALWIAFSLKYPMIYDEDYHIPVIKIFSHYWLPYIPQQLFEYDQYGNITMGDSLFFHYIMSFPYRVFAYFVHDSMAQVIFLRAVNILIAATGLYIFARLFDSIKIKKIHRNIGLLIFTLLPIVPLVAAQVNYDNALFPLTALYMLYAVRVVQSKRIVWQDIITLIIVGCFASLVKFTFLPLFAASVIYLLVIVFRRHGIKFFSRLWDSVRASTKKHYIVFGGSFLLFVGLFCYTYIKPAVQYGTPEPSCSQTLSEKRCSVGRQGALEARSDNAEATKDQRKADSVATFSIKWISNMHNISGLTAGQYFRQGLSTMSFLMLFGAFIGIGFLLYSWTSLRKNSGWYFLFTMTAVLILSIYLFNMSSYYKSYQYFANQPRYLLSMMPVLITMIVVACAYALRKHRNVKIAVFLVVMGLFTQGGGVITHILVSEDSWYWQRPKVIEANHVAKEILHPIVKEYFIKK
jgi:hypothetical protein